MFPKVSAVSIVFKNEDEGTYPTNILESFIKKEVVDHFKGNNVLGDKQYVFRSTRSTADNLLLHTELAKPLIIYSSLE